MLYIEAEESLELILVYTSVGSVKYFFCTKNTRRLYYIVHSYLVIQFCKITSFLPVLFFRCFFSRCCTLDPVANWFSFLSYSSMLIVIEGEKPAEWNSRRINRDLLQSIEHFPPYRSREKECVGQLVEPENKWSVNRWRCIQTSDRVAYKIKGADDL